MTRKGTTGASLGGRIIHTRGKGKRRHEPSPAELEAERAEELEAMNQPGAFVPKHLRGAIKGADGSLSVADEGWSRESWRK